MTVKKLLYNSGKGDQLVCGIINKKKNNISTRRKWQLFGYRKQSIQQKCRNYYSSLQSGD